MYDVYIGVDEQTALLMNATTGTAQVAGSGNVFICKATRNDDTTHCQENVPLTIKSESCLLCVPWLLRFLLAHFLL